MHYMIDLETLSTRVDSAIIEIGLAAFNEERVVKSHRWFVHPRQGHIDLSTVKWWLAQVEAGVPNPLNPKVPRMELPEALKDMTSRMKELETLWSHRSTFDIPILDMAYDMTYSMTGIEKPWNYKHIRDTVSFAMLYPGVPRVKPEEKHNAESDAVAQAQWIVNIFQYHRRIPS